MSTAPIGYLLSAAQEAGISWLYRDGTVVLRGPANAEPIVLELQRRKPEVIAILKPKRCTDCGEPSGSGVRCSPCAARRVVDWKQQR